MRILNRRSPQHRIDRTTGEGLDVVLACCDVALRREQRHVDAPRRRSSRAPRRLLASEAAAGVSHQVGVSIVGCEWHVLSAMRAPLQTFSCAEVARVVAKVAEGIPGEDA